MIQLLQREDIGRKTFHFGDVTVHVDAIKAEDVGKVLRYRRERPAKQQVDIVAREIEGSDV